MSVSTSSKSATAAPTRPSAAEKRRRHPSFAHLDRPARPSLADVARLLRDGEARNVIVMCGAGISTGAGIPDFRSPGTGLYDNLARYNLPYPEAIFDIDFLHERPEAFYTLAKELYPGNFKPTTTHYFFKLLQDKGLLKGVWTQNIDTLERMAGVGEDYIVEAHGSFASAACLKCGHEYTNESIRPDIMLGRVVRCHQKQPRRRHEHKRRQQRRPEKKKEAAAEETVSTSSTELRPESSESKVSSEERSPRPPRSSRQRRPGEDDDDDSTSFSSSTDESSGWEDSDDDELVDFDPKKDDDDDDDDDDDACRRCRGLVKPNIVFFGEGLPDKFFNRLGDFGHGKCDLLIVMGTSLSVGPFNSLVDKVSATCPRVLVNLERVGEARHAHDDEGFRFRDDDDGDQDDGRVTRDVFWQGETDRAVEKLCDLVGEGWASQLSDLQRRGWATLEAQQQQQQQLAAAAPSPRPGQQQQQEAEPLDGAAGGLRTPTQTPKPARDGPVQDLSNAIEQVSLDATTTTTTTTRG